MKFTDLNEVRLKRAQTKAGSQGQAASGKRFFKSKSSGEISLFDETVTKAVTSRSFAESMGYALEGLRYIYFNERNFRIDLMIAIGVVVLGLLTGLTLQEWIPIFLVMGLVLSAEIMNSVVEYTVDLYTQGHYDRRAKIIKDVAAAACLLAAACAAIIGLLIFLPKLGMLYA